MDKNLVLQVAVLGLALHNLEDEELSIVQSHFSDNELEEISNKFVEVMTIDNETLLNYLASEIKRLNKLV